MADESRRYTDREMGLILRLASEVDSRDAVAGAPGEQGGRTLREIEAIAADAGIAPEAVRLAAATLGSSVETSFFGRLLGAPTMFRIERHVPGEIGQREMLELTGTVRWMLAHEGELRPQEDRVEWQHHTAEGPLTHLELARIAGRTRIRLLAKYEDPAGWTMIGAGAATGLVSALSIATIEPSVAGSLGIVAAAGLSSWAAARAVWRGIAGRARRRLGWLMERLESQATELIAAGPGRSPKLVSGPTISDPDDTEPADREPS